MRTQETQIQVVRIAGKPEHFQVCEFAAAAVRIVKCETLQFLEVWSKTKHDSVTVSTAAYFTT